MKHTFHLLSSLLILLFVTLLISCQKESSTTTTTLKPNLPDNVFEYTITKGADGRLINLKNFIRDDSKTTFSNNSATLGRVLFYDKLLSLNNSISCGSCHLQELAFTDGTALSSGFKNTKTSRNTMGILNPILNHNLFWDSRASTMFELALNPVFDHIEMGMIDVRMLEDKLQNTSYYPALFKKAFGNEEVTSTKIALALSHFVNSIFSESSKFDHFTRNNIPLEPLENAGFQLFISPRLKCVECHAGGNLAAPDFPGGTYGTPIHTTAPEGGPRGTANIGLDLEYADKGRNNGHFRIPSLRNIALTAPYMHDGRFKTLEEVINHYDHGIKHHKDLDEKFLMNNQVQKLNLTNIEKKALVAFLRTLSDPKLITDEKFSNPFVN